MALGRTNGFTYNGYYRYCHGVLLQKEKVVINDTQITYQPQTAAIVREKVKKFPGWSLLVPSSSIEPKHLVIFTDRASLRHTEEN